MLDPKIKQGKKPLTGFDLDEAQDFIGEEGYFSNSVKGFVSLSLTKKGTLAEVETDDYFPFLTEDNNYSFFLPREWVTDNEPEPEKVWKPYNIETWKTQYDIGRSVEFRRKNPKNTQAIVRVVAYLGYSDNNGKIMILLGDTWFEFDELFRDFEIRDYRYNKNHKVEYRPFGYLE